MPTKPKQDTPQQAGRKTGKPPENQAGKFDRVVRLMILLKAGSYITMNDMVRELAVDKRTVRRYLQSLESGGVPTIYDPVRRAYRIEKSQLLNMPQLRVDEALAVIAALSVVKKTACLAAGQQALAKVLGALPGPIRREIGEIETTPYIRPEPASLPGSESQNYNIIREAIRDSTRLAAEYHSVSRGTHEKIQLEPYELFFQHRAWYVVGKAKTTLLNTKPATPATASKAPSSPQSTAPAETGKQPVRIYKIMRLSRLINTLKPFVKPRSFSLDNHLGLAWNIAPGEERYRVRIRFDAHVSSLISETYWHKTQVLTPLEDGGLLFESTVDGLNEIVWWVLSFGSHARVEEPRELREMVMGEAKALAS